MELSKIYTHWLEIICMEQWAQTIIYWLSKWLESVLNYTGIIKHDIKP